MSWCFFKEHVLYFFIIVFSVKIVFNSTVLYIRKSVNTDNVCLGSNKIIAKYILFVNKKPLVLSICTIIIL